MKRSGTRKAELSLLKTQLALPLCGTYYNLFRNLATAEGDRSLVHKGHCAPLIREPSGHAIIAASLQNSVQNNLFREIVIYLFYYILYKCTYSESNYRVQHLLFVTRVSYISDFVTGKRADCIENHASEARISLVEVTILCHRVSGLRSVTRYTARRMRGSRCTRQSAMYREQTAQKQMSLCSDSDTAASRFRLRRLQLHFVLAKREIRSLQESTYHVFRILVPQLAPNVTVRLCLY